MSKLDLQLDARFREKGARICPEGADPLAGILILTMGRARRAAGAR